MEGEEVLEYLELQDSMEMLTKSQLLEHVRNEGGSISDRQLTTYISEGLVPRSIRVGSRTGAFPRIIGDLLVWISIFRKRGLSIEAIKELLPLWRFLQRSFREGSLDLGEFQYRARQFVSSREAQYAIPNLFTWCIPCPHCDTDALKDIDFVMKDGQSRRQDAQEPISIGFMIWDQDDDSGAVTPADTMRITVPMENEEDHPSTVWLGIPNEVDPIAEQETTATVARDDGKEVA